jgi:hypothetical protein
LRSRKRPGEFALDRDLLPCCRRSAAELAYADRHRIAGLAGVVLSEPLTPLPIWVFAS